LRDWEGAEADLQAVLERKPPPDQAAVARYSLGHVLAERTRWSEAIRAYDEAEKGWPAGTATINGVNLLNVRSAAALAALGRADVADYTRRCTVIAESYLNSDDPTFMKQILWLQSLEPSGRSGLFHVSTYIAKLKPYYADHLVNDRWGRSILSSYLTWSSQAPRNPQLSPALKPILDRIASQDLPRAATAGERIRATMLLAVLYQRSGQKDEANRWAAIVQDERPPDGWEAEMNWIDRVWFASVRTSFQQAFPRGSK
jgi:hypothetical protein